MKDKLMIGVTRVIESPYHDDIGEADMAVKYSEIESFVRVHGPEKAEEKIRSTFEAALKEALRTATRNSHTSDSNCWCEPEEVEPGLFVHKRLN